MEKYNYYEVVCEDVKNYVTENYDLNEIEDWDEFEEKLNEELWVADTVTGNASGSYTFSTWQAEEYLCHNWDVLEAAIIEFGCSDVDVIEKGAEWCDVAIRCYWLSQCISDVLEQLKR